MKRAPVILVGCLALLLPERSVAQDHTWDTSAPPYNFCLTCQVGVGVSFPAANEKMRILHSGTNGVNLSLRNADGGYMLQFSDAADFAYYMSVNASGNHGWIGESESSGLIFKTGKLGIGTTAPTGKLEIRGGGQAAEALVFGNANPTYVSSLGAFDTSGQPFLAFFGRHSATANTLKRTAGGFGVSALSGDTAGNLSVQVAPTGAADSDATLTT